MSDFDSDSDGFEMDTDSDWTDCGLTWDTGDGGMADPRSGFEQDDASDGLPEQTLPHQEIAEQSHYKLASESESDDEDVPLRERGVFGLIFDELSNVLKGR